MTDLKISVHQLQTDRGRVQLLRKYLVKNRIRFKFVTENEIFQKLVVSISSENKRWKNLIWSLIRFQFLHKLFT